jgi:hypothetical protein
VSARNSRSRGEGHRGKNLLLASVLAAVVPTLASPPASADDRPAPEETGAVVVDEDLTALLRDLPSSGTVWSTLETVEPMAIVDRIDGAGLYAAEPGRFALRGSSWTQNAFVLDGLDLTDPVIGGTPLVLPDVVALDSFAVTSALGSQAQAGPGATVTLRERSPSSSWAGTVEANGLGSALQSAPTDSPPPVARFGSRAEGSAVAAGPLGEPTLRLVVAGHFVRARRFERDDEAPLDSRLASGLAALTWHPDDADVLRLTALGQAVRRPLSSRALFPGEARQESVAGLASVVRWEHTGARATASAFAGLVSARARDEQDGRDSATPVERLLDGPVPSLVLPDESRRSSASLGATITWRETALGAVSHAPRLGFSLRGAWSSEAAGPGGPIAETVDGVAARVWEYAPPGPDSRRHLLDLAAWAGDRLAWGSRLAVDVGLRLERTTGSAEGARVGVAWTTLLPRLSARLRLVDAGRITLFGGWGESRQRLLLDHLAFGDPGAPRADVFRWVDANGDGAYAPDERGALVARVGPGDADGSLATIDTGLRPPMTREAVAGLSARVGGVALQLTAVDRHESDLLESVDVGAPASAYAVLYLPDPGSDIVGAGDDQLLPVFDRQPASFGQDRYVLTNPGSHTGRHQSLEVRAEKAVGRLAFLAGATASRTEVQGGNRGFRVDENDQGVVGELFDDPNADTYARGRGFFDRAFTIKAAAAWRAPGGWRLGVVARYQDGQPFARVVVVQGLAQGPEAVSATTRGQTWGRTNGTDPAGRTLSADGHRFTYTLTLDARLEKRVPIGGARLGLIVEAFNVLGTRHEVEEDPVWGTSFRDPTALQPPRVLRLGARVDF